MPSRQCALSLPNGKDDLGRLEESPLLSRMRLLVLCYGACPAGGLPGEWRENAVGFSYPLSKVC